MFPKSVFPDTAEVNADGHLVIGGCTAQALADEYGTPVYVLDEATIRAKCRAFVSEFSQRAPGARVAYACKAYINPALARVLNEEGLGFDVVSGGELARRRTYCCGCRRALTPTPTSTPPPASSTPSSASPYRPATPPSPCGRPWPPRT